VTRDDVVLRLRRLLDLPVELVLPAHGERTDPDLERVLQRAAASVSISP
jgi:glyoxylase-like metal-dependent hydrolase (beta-lactamase superfamily II)